MLVRVKRGRGEVTKGFTVRNNFSSESTAKNIRNLLYVRCNEVHCLNSNVHIFIFCGIQIVCFTKKEQ